MANSSKRQRRLWDTYTFPGFRPQPTVRGVFGDPKARIITLARRAKKRFAGAAGEFIRVGTTGVYGRFAICRAAIGPAWMKTTPIHELERYMRCKECSQVRGYADKRDAPPCSQ